MTTENTGTQAAPAGTGSQATTTAASESSTASTATQAGQAGQSAAEGGQAAREQASSGGTEQHQQQEQTFFDPKSLEGRPELQAAYRQMQKAYTQKTQAIAADRRKIEAYDQFASNPDAIAQYLAQQGYQVLRPGQQAQTQAPSGGTPETRPFEPQTWDEVYTEAERRIIARLDERLGPVMNNLRETTAKNIESQLNGIDPNWRLYEDDMKETLRAHPTLVKDVAKLYRMSVPEDVLHSRAVQEALTKHGQRIAAASVHGSGTTQRTTSAPRKVNSFQDAVEVAKEQLRASGGR